MTNPTTPETVTEAQRNTHLWEIVLKRLQDCDASDAQLEALRAVAQLADEELPIAEIAEMVLMQTSDDDGTLYFSDSDDFWSEGIEALQRAPERLDLDPVVEVLMAAFENDTSTDQILEFIEAFVGEIETQPFADLLDEDEPALRRAGLEALFKLEEVAPLLPLLADPDPATRAIAIENVWLLSGMPREQLQTMADDPAQPQEARGMAAHYLEKSPVTASA